MEFIFILITAIVVIAIFVAFAGRSSGSTYPEPRPEEPWEEDEYIEESTIGSITFIQINQFINFNGSYPPLASYNEKIPRFVNSANGFRAKGMQSRYHNFKQLLVSNRLKPGNEYRAVVTLQIEPSNKFDQFAVLVTFRGLPLAYVPKEYSHAFHSVLAPVGGAALCLADIWFDGKFHRGGKQNSITLLTSTYPQLEN